MTQKIVQRCRHAVERFAISEFENGENVKNLNMKPAFILRTWVAYVLFNVGLFLPVFIFKVSDAVKVQLNVEVAVLFGLWAIFGGRCGKRVLRWFAAGFGLFYMVALVYKSYAGALLGLYLKDANFFNDYSFVIGGMSFLLDALNFSIWVYLAGVTGIIFLIGLIFWGARTIFEGVPVPALGRATRLGLIALGLIAILIGSLFPQKTADLQMPLSSVITEMMANIRRSLESRENLKNFYDDRSNQLLTITLSILFPRLRMCSSSFIESYGSVVYKRPHFTPAYLQMLEVLEKSLNQ